MHDRIASVDLGRDGYSSVVIGHVSHGCFIIDETHIWSTGPPDHIHFDASFRTTSQRADEPLAITDGSVRPDRVLYTWPMIMRRARGPLEELLFDAHRPEIYHVGIRPDCHTCDTTWPCENARVILDTIGLTEHDFDFRPEDNGASPL